VEPNKVGKQHAGQQWIFHSIKACPGCLWFPATLKMVVGRWSLTFLFKSMEFFPSSDDDQGGHFCACFDMSLEGILCFEGEEMVITWQLKGLCRCMKMN